ncbi:MAG: hypothetical protein HY843_05625, partial [Bdellovibrio sp.]|nr:hypothetical protein [Bdellovibrio sp.]
LIPVSEIKENIDEFFLDLDGKVSSDPNYFVVSIVALTADAIKSLQQARDLDDQKVGALKSVAIDRGDRYLELVQLVGNNSLGMNIAEEDYSILLEQIGKTIIDKKSTFTLQRAPTSAEDMIVKIIHEDGSSTIIPSEKFVIQGKSLVINDFAMVLSFKSTDKISINYQPKTVF